MEEVRFRYRCPACDKGILNRKIDRCLYCGATLPPELLLSKEIVAELDRQQQDLEEKRNREKSPKIDESSDSGFGLGDIIEIASDIGGLFD
ncbi:hypothetical protein [Janthinobacterium sp. 17J80-10]|uniref:hypothetical protein n=1 Tax=Janthinobacterium sp. 17J80-10 TaxID=2497863 RepID=UPI0010056F3B|nr:hypothetical protein [Janthinobacterium sp. 17J80-10]QAU33426.1 hypothetical protein EKL02_04070 [Janthinobacterium sp. 17J80-10]